MPEGPSSFARALLSPIRAAFVAEYAASQEAPRMPHIELITIILPQCSRSISGRAARITLYAPSTLTEKSLRQSSGVVSCICFTRLIPAFKTRTPAPPELFTRASASLGSETSALNAVPPMRPARVSAEPWLLR